MRTAHDFARDFTNPVLLPQRNYFLMRRILEDAVGRSINNGRTRSHVLGAEFGDDLGARGRLVAERAASDAAFELVHDFAREAVRIQGEGLIEDDSRHFPMAGGRVLAGRRQRAAAESARGSIGGRNAGDRPDVANPQAREIRQMKPANARDIAERVRSGGIEVGDGIRHGADSHAIQDDPNDSLKRQIRG